MFYNDLLMDEKIFNIEKTTYSHNVSMNSSHYHSHYEILYIEDGIRTITINESKKYTLNKDCIALIPPNIIHYTQSASEKQTRTLINISPRLMDDIIGFTSKNIIACFDALILPLSEADTRMIKYYFALLERHNSDNASLHIETIKSSLCSLLSLLSNTYYSLLHNENSEVTKPSDIADKVMYYISQHYYEDITLSDLATSVSLSKDHLIRTFEKKYNITPIKFLNTFRIINSKRLLESGAMSVSDVAQACGYNSNTSFTRTFKQITGETPKEYQLRFRDNKKMK